MSAGRVLIFANGKLPNLRAAQALIQADDWLVAADGGARCLAKMGFVPHLVVGDMDSLAKRTVNRLARAGAQIERHPVEKDETDLELAVRAVLARGFRSVRIIGALGGRIDQTLGNLFLLNRPEFPELDIRLDDGVEEVFFIRGQVEIKGKAGDIVSLLALGQPVQGISTKGLRYPLRGETLTPGQTRGISNVMTAETAIVAHAGGELVCVHTRKS